LHPVINRAFQLTICNHGEVLNRRAPSPNGLEAQHP
jgi:hypothetical protein